LHKDCTRRTRWGHGGKVAGAGSPAKTRKGDRRWKQGAVSPEEAKLKEWVVTKKTVDGETNLKKKAEEDLVV